MILDRHRWESSPTVITAAGGASHYKESFTIRILSRNKDLVRRLLRECRQQALPDDDRVDILVANYTYWRLGTRIKPRPLDSVLLDGNQAALLLADTREFLDSAAWYHHIGIPYRRGYLLYGPPGKWQDEHRKARSPASWA